MAAIKSTIDLRDLNCPYPIMETRKAVNTIAPGERIRILTDNPEALRDIGVFCNKGGHLFTPDTIDQAKGCAYVLQKA